MFTAALFTIAKKWKQTKYPSTVEWIKMWYIYIHWNISHKNENLPFATWMDLEELKLNEVSQTKTNTVCFHLYVES